MSSEVYSYVIKVRDDIATFLRSGAEESHERVVSSHYGGQVSVIELLRIMLRHSTHHLRQLYWFMENVLLIAPSAADGRRSRRHRDAERTLRDCQPLALSGAQGGEAVAGQIRECRMTAATAREELRAVLRWWSVTGRHAVLVAWSVKPAMCSCIRIRVGILQMFECGDRVRRQRERLADSLGDVR